MRIPFGVQIVDRVPVAVKHTAKATRKGIGSLLGFAAIAGFGRCRQGNGLCGVLFVHIQVRREFIVLPLRRSGGTIGHFGPIRDRRIIVRCRMRIFANLEKIHKIRRGLDQVWISFGPRTRKGCRRSTVVYFPFRFRGEIHAVYSAGCQRECDNASREHREDKDRADDLFRLFHNVPPMIYE